MGLSHSPRIATNGLVLCLDAGNTRSYPGSGTTWTDLSGLGKITTLVNGPTFSSGNGGSIAFDGTNDYVTFDGSSEFAFGTGDYSVEFFIRFGSLTSPQVIFETRTSTSGNAGTVQWYINNGTVGYNFFGTSTALIFTTSFVTNTWYHIVFSRIGTTFRSFVNGVQDASLTDSTNLIVGTSRPIIGTNGFTPTQDFFVGNISVIRFYKGKGLTQAEIRQNFNATRGRYGI